VPTSAKPRELRSGNGTSRLEALGGLEPHDVTRFAGARLHPEPAKAMRAPGRNRTAGPRVRNPVLYPLSYEGMRPDHRHMKRVPT
jgi:hypothetical protein